MKTAYSYVRFSTAGQAKGDSLRRQSKEALNSEAWCKQNGYSLSDEVYFDAGKSGYKGDNSKEGGELHRFMQLVKENKIRDSPILRFTLIPGIFCGFVVCYQMATMGCGWQFQD